MKTTERTENSTAQLQSPAKLLREEFLKRKARNASYSTRAFARDLGISQALLSMILNGKRPLTAKQAAQISVLLGHSREEARKFLELALLSLPENSKGLSKLRRQQLTSSAPLFTDYNVERFKIISQWHHVAILDLVSTRGFRADPTWIATRLGISSIEARDAVERLVETGFLERENGKLRKTQSKVFFKTQRSEPAVRAFHRQMIAKAQEKLDLTSDEDFAKREISAITMAVRKDRIAEAKTKILEFQRELVEFLTEGECDEVFQLNVQLFPLTKTMKKGDPI